MPESRAYARVPRARDGPVRRLRHPPQAAVRPHRYLGRVRRLALIAAAAAVLALPAAAAAGPGLLLGIDDDMGKWAASSPVAGSIADLGATVQRITVIWLPGQADLPGIEAQNVQSAIARAPR